MVPHRISRARLAAYALASTTFFACSASPDAPSTGRSAVGIISGTRSLSEDDAVVRLQIDRTTWTELCTGTIVAPNLVLTARHCVGTFHMAAPDGALSCLDPDGGAGTFAAVSLTPSRITVLVGESSNTADDSTQATKIFTPPGRDMCGDDVAIVMLAKDLAPAPRAMRLGAPIVVGETFTAVGFGEEASGRYPPYRMKREGMPVLGVGPGVLYERTLRDDQFMTTDGPCYGDSGSPALSTTTSAILGVAEGGSNGGHYGTVADCTGPDARFVYTSLAAHRDWIEAAFAEAGHDPIVEDTSGDAGASDDAGTDDAAPPEDANAETGAPPLGEGSGGGGGCITARAAPSDANAAWIAGAIALVVTRAKRRRRA